MNYSDCYVHVHLALLICFEIVLDSFAGPGNFSQQAWLLIGAECENPR